MAVMKVLLSTDKTMYIHKPHDIAYIQDVEGGLKLGMPDYIRDSAKIKTTLTAKAFKRQIQENSREESAWLKINLDYISKTARMYVNAKDVVAIEGYIRQENIDGKTVPAFYTQFYMSHSGYMPHLKIDPTELNRQLYRIQNRLEQDEDICCTEKVTVEPSSE